MGSGKGDSSDGGTSPPGSPWDREPEPIELIVELDDVDIDGLPARGVNSAASDFETIDADGLSGARSRLMRLPRAVRIAGVAVAAVVLTIAAWPTSGARQAVPQPVPTPSPVDTDLYKVGLGQTTLQAEQDDHATLGLQLTNSASADLTVVSAEVWDAQGTRFGSAATWPAKDLAAETTALVPVTLPYTCSGFGHIPVLPITIRYSVSSPLDPNVRRDYAFPLTDYLWEAFTRERITQCVRLSNDPSAPNDEDQVDVAAIDTTQPIGAPSDPQGFDLTFMLEATGKATWELDRVASDSDDVTVTTAETPVAVSPGRGARVTTHWHVKDCARPPAGNPGSGFSDVSFTVREPGATGPGAAGQKFYAQLQQTLIDQMVQVACGI